MKRKAIARVLRMVGLAIFAPITPAAVCGIAWVGYNLYARGEIVPAAILAVLLIGAAAMTAAKFIDGGAS